VLFTSYTGWIRSRAALKLLVRVKFTGNPYSYRTRINVNGRQWNTCVSWNPYMGTQTPICVYVNVA